MNSSAKFLPYDFVSWFIIVVAVFIIMTSLKVLDDGIDSEQTVSTIKKDEVFEEVMIVR